MRGRAKTIAAAVTMAVLGSRAGRRDKGRSRRSPHGRAVQRRFAELIRDGRPRRAYAALGPAQAATAAGGRTYAALMWLFGSSQAPKDSSDMLLTVAAEDVVDAAPELFRQTAERIPNARLALYHDKGHAGVLTHGPAIREIVDFLRAGEPSSQGRQA